MAKYILQPLFVFCLYSISMSYEALGIVLDEVDPTLFDPECLDLINIVLDFLIPGCNFVSS